MARLDCDSIIPRMFKLHTLHVVEFAYRKIYIIGLRRRTQSGRLHTAQVPLRLASNKSFPDRLVLQNEDENNFWQKTEAPQLQDRAP
jgi:hypothetical protein